MTKKHNFSEEELLNLVSLYNDGYSGVDLAKLTKKSLWAIYTYIKTVPGFKVRSVSDAARKYSIYENYFDKIDTEEKAYFLGFLYADGSINDEGEITLSQAEQDKEIVFKFANVLGKDLSVKTFKDKRPNRQTSYHVNVRSIHMANMLAKHGCSPRKTFIIKFPNFLEAAFIKHFIRGYFDGDGCLSINTRNRKGRGKDNKHLVVSSRPGCDFTIVSTMEFVSEVKKIFEREIDINCHITKRHKNRDNNNYTLVVSGRQQIIKAASWLYNDATIYLSRKFNKYLEISNPKFNVQVSSEEMYGHAGE